MTFTNTITTSTIPDERQVPVKQHKEKDPNKVTKKRKRKDGAASKKESRKKKVINVESGAGDLRKSSNLNNDMVMVASQRSAELRGGKRRHYPEPTSNRNH